MPFELFCLVSPEGLGVTEGVRLDVVLGVWCHAGDDGRLSSRLRSWDRNSRASHSWSRSAIDVV